MLVVVADTARGARGPTGGGHFCAHMRQARTYTTIHSMPSPFYLQSPSPTDVRTIGCPFCDAAPEEFCTGVRRKQRKANHQERVLAWTFANLAK